MVLPLNLLWKVRISRAEKQGLAAVFSIGFLIIIFAITRAIQVAFTSTSDPVLLALWGVIESTVCMSLPLPFYYFHHSINVAVAVIVGCLPPFKSLFARRGNTTNANSNGYRKQYDFSNDLRNGSIPLDSRITHNTRIQSTRDKKENMRSESMEGIVTPPDAFSSKILVQRDIVSFFPIQNMIEQC
jgi:hypothetical protein